jgi:hypothetical protein
MKIYHTLTISIFLFIAFFLSEMFLKIPAIWPDEAIYADIAGNILKDGRLGTDLWKGVIPGVENHAYWYPPLFFYSLAGWFKLTGLSIVNQRLFSVLIGSIFIIIFFRFSRSLIKQSGWPIWFPTLALILDFTFIRSSLISRPEILILLFGISALWFFIEAVNSQKKRTQTTFYVLSGLFAAFTVLTHFIGIFILASIISYLFIEKKVSFIKQREFYIILTSFFLPIIIWISSIITNLTILRQQFLLAFARKSMEEPWIWIAFKTQTFDLKLIYLIYLLISVIFILFSFYFGKKQYRYLSLVLFFSWFFCFYGKMFWYFVFPIPFIYLSLSILILEIYNFWQNYKTNINKQLFCSICAISLLLVFLNVKLLVDSFFQQSGNSYSYDKFVNEIIKLIPQNRTVFLSSIPDPYYGLKINRPGNSLYEFPVLETSKENYLKNLNDSDFIIYNGSYDFIFGDLLVRYIEKNALKISKINEPLQYQTIVIELKSKIERISP